MSAADWGRLGERGPNGRNDILSQTLPWLGLILAVAAFVVDLWLPIGVNVGPVYVLSVLATFRHPSRVATVGMAALTSVATAVGFVHPAVTFAVEWIALVNAGVVFVAIWTTAYSVLAYSRATVRVSEVEFKAREDETWLAQTLASIGDGVIAVDRTGKIKFMNSVAERLTGWQSAEAVGRPLEDVFDIRDEETGERAANPMSQVLSEGERAVLASHTNLVSRDGETWPIEDSASPIRDERGGMHGSVMVFREISDRRKGEQQMELRLRESGHRIRNVFANMRAMLRLCERTSETPAELVKCVEVRIASLMRSTELLLRAKDGGTSSREIIVGELAPYLEAGPEHLHIAGDDVLLGASQAVPFAMIVHELANNAAKYGSLSTNGGRVDVRCERREEGELVLDWREIGGPIVNPPTRRGLGSQLITGLVRSQFSGEWKPDFAPDGFRCLVVLQLPSAPD